MEHLGVCQVLPTTSGQDVGYSVLLSWEYFMAEGCFIYKTNDGYYIMMTDPQEY